MDTELRRDFTAFFLASILAVLLPPSSLPGEPRKNRHAHSRQTKNNASCKHKGAFQQQHSTTPASTPACLNRLENVCIAPPAGAGKSSVLFRSSIPPRLPLVPDRPLVPYIAWKRSAFRRLLEQAKLLRCPRAPFMTTSSIPQRAPASRLGNVCIAQRACRRTQAKVLRCPRAPSYATYIP